MTIDYGGIPDLFFLLFDLTFSTFLHSNFGLAYGEKVQKLSVCSSIPCDGILGPRNRGQIFGMSYILFMKGAWLTDD
jgi:hypothetical protein